MFTDSEKAEMMQLENWKEKGTGRGKKNILILI